MSIRKLIDLVEGETTVLDRPPVQKKEEVPLHIPGGSTVIVLNDNFTPFEVAVEAVVYATGLSAGEAANRMMAAHSGGGAPVACYQSYDIAEAVADKIVQHARNNKDYDHYRQFMTWKGPWPLHAEVLDAY